jgi:pilus assembly protein CpaC
VRSLSRGATGIVRSHLERLPPMKKPFLYTAVLVLVLGATAYTAASNLDTSSALPGASLTAAQASGSSVKLQVGRSQHFKTTWPTRGASLTDVAVADVQVLTPNLIQVMGKAPGRTTVLAWSEANETLEFEVEVVPDLDRLTRELNSMFPRGKMQVTQNQTVVLVNGTLERAEQAEQLHHYMEALKMPFVDMTILPGVQQVQVQVRMAEVSRSALRQLGVNGVATGSDAFLGSNLGASNQSGIAPAVTSPATGNTSPVNGPTNISPAVTLFGGLSRGDLEIFLQALAENQYLRVLAEPNLVALSGAEANFLAGGEIPIPVVQGGSGNGNSVTIEFKPFGIALKFRPVVTGEGGIRLTMASEVSDVTEGINQTTVEFGGIRVPGIQTRRTETSLELKSGQTFAVSGLISERTNAVVSKIPVLGDLPILGTLFRSVQYRTGETELLVLVTASLVEPMSTASPLPMPGQSHVAPNDWELYVEGRIEGRAAAKLAAPDQTWLREQGLDQLRGPGAWMNYEQRPAQSTARPEQQGVSNDVRELEKHGTQK